MASSAPSGSDRAAKLIIPCLPGREAILCDPVSMYIDTWLRIVVISNQECKASTFLFYFDLFFALYQERPVIIFMDAKFLISDDLGETKDLWCV
jgi:hypothetical protein